MRQLKDGILNINNKMPLTCVSAFFSIKNKYEKKDYIKWFENTLSIDCPYVFFSDKESIDIIKSFRIGLPTYYIEIEITDFYTYKYKDRMITHPVHCPSIELNLIWNEKIFFLQKAYQINPFKSDWFKWIDAGLCIFRDEKPPITVFPNITRLCSLPKDKFIYSSSSEYDESLVSITNYYHHISGTYLLHKYMINIFVEMYKEYLDTLIDTNNIWTDQVILTHMYKATPENFYKLCDGYGEITRFLF